MSHGGGGGSEKCLKSVTYYLNGPLLRKIYIFSVWSKYLQAILAQGPQNTISSALFCF